MSSTLPKTQEARAGICQVARWLLLGLLLVGVRAWGTVLEVPAQYPTIQAAIDHCAQGEFRCCAIDSPSVVAQALDDGGQAAVG